MQDVVQSAVGRLDASPHADAVRTAQLRLLYRGLPLSLIASSLLALIAIGVLWSEVKHTAAILWLIVMFTVTARRAVSWRSFQRTESASAGQLRSFRFGCVAAGATWGMASLFLFPHSINDQVFLAFVIAGVSAGATTSLAPDRRAALAFVLPCVLPLAARLLLLGTAPSAAMGAMVVLYGIFLFAALNRTYRSLLENVALRLKATEREQLLQEHDRQLSQAHSQLRSVIDSATHVSIIATDLQGTIINFNSGAQQMLGYGDTEVIGNTGLLALHLAEEIELRSKELSQELGYAVSGLEVLVHGARRGRPEEREWIYVRKDASHMWVNLIVSGVYDQGKVLIGFLAIATDITARKRALREMSLARAQLETFIEHAPVAVAMLDRELRYIAYSQRWLSDYRLQGQSLVGRSHYEVFKNIGSAWKDVHQRCLQGAELPAVESEGR